MAQFAEPRARGGRRGACLAHRVMNAHHADTAAGRQGASNPADELLGCFERRAIRAEAEMKTGRATHKAARLSENLGVQNGPVVGEPDFVPTLRRECRPAGAIAALRRGTRAVGGRDAAGRGTTIYSPLIAHDLPDQGE